MFRLIQVLQTSSNDHITCKECIEFVTFFQSHFFQALDNKLNWKVKIPSESCTIPICFIISEVTKF